MSKEIKIGVISDTHLLRDDGRFLRLIENYFKDCQLIIHCGDIVNTDIFAPVKTDIIAVRGNMDTDASLPVKREISILNKKISIIHGYGAPAGIRGRIRKEFENPDCILYGHTHCPFSGYEDNILFFNPGSAFDKRWAPKNTIGYLYITDTAIRCEIREID